MTHGSKLVALAALSVGVASCASAPEYIKPALVGPEKYQAYTCEGLAAERNRVQDAYNEAAKKQNKARNDDALGVLLIGLPVDSMSGKNLAKVIALLKGELAAIQETADAKSCPR